MWLEQLTVSCMKDRKISLFRVLIGVQVYIIKWYTVAAVMLGCNDRLAFFCFFNPHVCV